MRRADFKKMLAVCFLSLYSVCMQAQESIWYKPNNRFEENQEFSLKNIDSIEFRTNQMRMYSDSLKMGYTIKTYKTDGVYQFTNPGLIIYKLVGNVVTGWTSMMVLMLFLFGLNFAFLGVLGEYIGRIFLETKQRPNFIIEQVV